MSEKPVNNIRYLRQNALEQERKIMENYFNDFINNYGVDVTYYRNDIKFPDQIDLTPSLTGLENLIYGESSNMSYYLSGGMVIYLEVENDIFEMNKYGTYPNENINIYFTINDFNTRFASQLGKKKSFYDNVTFSGIVSGPNVVIDVPFVGDDILSGTLSATVTSATGTTSISAFDVSFDTTSGYKIPINPYISKTKYYTVSGGEYMAGSNGTVTMTTSTYTGSAQVGVLYYEPESTSKYHSNIMPQVGDFFRMSFFDDNHEEFEITNIADKMMTPGGFNILLQKYIWKCSAVRRNPSYEDVIGDQQTEETNNDEQLNLESYAIEEITNTIHDYTDNRDDVYGGYENTDSPLVSSEVDTSTVNTSGVIFTFNYSGLSYLVADVYNLYFFNKSGDSIRLSDDTRSTGTIPTDIIGLKYLRTDGDNLFYVNNSEESWQLTNNFDADPYVNEIIDITTIQKQDDDFVTSGMHCILDNNMILYSDGDNLFCMNDSGETTQITNL